MSISVLNTDAGLSGKTIANLEDTQTFTGQKTFDRDPLAPFVVSSGSAVVTNLDADAVDGAHYAVGAWTPIIGGSTSESGQVYSVSTGRYRKIGTCVEARGRITLSTLGTVTGNIRIQGLPFTSSSTANNHGTVHFGFFNNFTSSVVWLSGIVETNSTAATLYAIEAAAATGTSVLAQADLSDTTDLIFTIIYEAAS